LLLPLLDWIYEIVPLMLLLVENTTSFWQWRTWKVDGASRVVVEVVGAGHAHHLLSPQDSEWQGEWAPRIPLLAHHFFAHWKLPPLVGTWVLCEKCWACFGACL
jgi:hypothetical protein